MSNQHPSNEEDHERTKAYETYVRKITNHRSYGSKRTPIPQHRWEWKTCYLCKKTIRDDPFGFHPYPLCEATDTESRVCGFCNQCFVLPNRRMLRDPPEWESRTPQEIRDDGRRYEESIRAMDLEDFKQKVAACEYWKPPSPRGEEEDGQK